MLFVDDCDKNLGFVWTDWDWVIEEFYNWRCILPCPWYVVNILNNAKITLRKWVTFSKSGDNLVGKRIIDSSKYRSCQLRSSIFFKDNVTKIKELLKLSNYPSSLINEYIIEYKHKTDPSRAFKEDKENSFHIFPYNDTNV